MAGIHVSFDVSLDDLLAELTNACYQVALQYGINVPFLDIEIDMMEALRKVIRKKMCVSEACGSGEHCLTAPRFIPWSIEAKQILHEEEDELTENQWYESQSTP